MIVEIISREYKKNLVGNAGGFLLTYKKDTGETVNRKIVSPSDELGKKLKDLKPGDKKNLVNQKDDNGYFQVVDINDDLTPKTPYKPKSNYSNNSQSKSSYDNLGAQVGGAFKVAADILTSKVKVDQLEETALAVIEAMERVKKGLGSTTTTSVTKAPEEVPGSTVEDLDDDIPF